MGTVNKTAFLIVAAINLLTLECVTLKKLSKQLPPINIRAVYNTETSIIIHWEPPETTLPVWAYLVASQPAESAKSGHSYTVPVNIHKCTIDDLEAGMLYSISISAQYDDVHFADSDTMTVATRNGSEEVDCNCNQIGTNNGSLCYDVTLQCFCKDGFVGLQCDMCAENHYRDHTQECKPCPCLLEHSTGPCNTDEDNNVICIECKEGYNGYLCNECVNGTHYMQGIECVPCECNGQGTCDPEFGICHCANHTEGTNCEICANGYVGDPMLGIACSVQGKASHDGFRHHIIVAFLLVAIILLSLIVCGYIYHRYREQKVHHPYFTVELRDDSINFDGLENDRQYKANLLIHENR